MKHLGASYPVEGPERQALIAREIANATPLYHPSVMWEQLNDSLWRDVIEQIRIDLFNGNVTPPACGRLRWIRSVT